MKPADPPLNNCAGLFRQTEPPLSGLLFGSHLGRVQAETPLSRLCRLAEPPLFPADRKINQRLKRDKLPSAGALAGAQSQIETWWQHAWEQHPTFGDRFRREANVALAVRAGATLPEIFEALEWRRLRLRQDAQVTEWPGARELAQ